MLYILTETIIEYNPADLEAWKNGDKDKSKSTHSEAKGEPDLFLYMDNGPKLFLEVKKDTDKVFDAQLECLAQIRRVLGAEIGIVHLVPYGSQYTPKVFELDLVTYKGKPVAP